VETDPIQLHRTLAILVDNALKYSEEGSPVDLALSREDGRAVISVADRGCGIPEAEIPHIFDRFYRAQGSSAPTARASASPSRTRSRATSEARSGS
jgi:signal transduction histidine kinase